MKAFFAALCLLLACSAGAQGRRLLVDAGVSCKPAGLGVGGVGWEVQEVPRWLEQACKAALLPPRALISAQQLMGGADAPWVWGRGAMARIRWLPALQECP